MKKITTLLFLGILSISFVLASQSLGTFPKDSTINLVQSCVNSTYSNITRVTYPGTSTNSSFAIEGETIMTGLISDTFNYSFSLTSEIGNYIVYGHCDEDGIKTAWVYDFEITSTGEQVSLSNSIIVIVFLILAAVFLVLGYSFSKEHWILKTFFNFCAVGMGILAMNSAKIIASESSGLGKMGTAGLTLMIIVLGIFFIYMFIYSFIEIIKALREKRGVRWDYD